VEPEAKVWWEGMPAEWRVSEDGFVDSAAYHTTVSGISRPGFSSAQIDPAGSVVGVCYGIVPLQLAPLQQAIDDEDMAFLSTHCERDPENPLHVYDDCAAT
ncbi:unnamed protein product, partial [Prorocentrum cordatum]